MAKIMNSLLVFILFRLSNILFNQTWFVPDEYWQSQEVAHNLAFNYGYLTWEWKVGIRSYLYPFSLSIIYKALEFFKLDQTFIFIMISPILHCILTAIGDELFYKYVSHLYGSKIGWTATLLRCISWFSIYMSPRSLTNSLEELFTILVLYCLSSKKIFLFHMFAFVEFVIRPTAAINLIPIYFFAFFRHSCSKPSEGFWPSISKLRFVSLFLLAGLLVLPLSTLIDSYFYGSFLLTPLNFLIHNVLNNVGVHYGTHPWHWYLSQGFPTILFAHIVPFSIGVFFAFYNKKLYFELSAISFNIFVYSLLSHKEFRFLSQIMPFAMIVCAFGIESFKNKLDKNKFLALLTTANFGLLVFVGLIHQRGPISVMNHLRTLDLDERSESILFLTPCHSTPYYSYLHRNITMRFLTCEPNLTDTKNEAASYYLDEADRFYSNHESWFRENWNEINKKPSRLVIYENLYRRLSTTSEFVKNFTHCEKFFHSPVKDSERVDNYIYLCTNENYLSTVFKKSSKEEL